MKPIIKKVEVKGAEYYNRHLQIVNCLLNLSLQPKEIEVLAEFMNLDKNLTEEDMFNTVARKKVREKLKQSPGGLGNHLKSMLRKNVISKKEITGKITIKGYLFPEDDKQGYKILLTKEKDGVKE